MASHLFPLVLLDLLLFKYSRFTILIIGNEPERGPVRRCIVNLTVTGNKRFLGPLVRLRHTGVDGVRHLVAAVIVEGPGDGILSLALRSTSSDVAMAFSGHGSDHTRAFRVGKCGFLGCGEITRRIEGYPQLTLHVVEIELLLLYMALCVGVVLAV